MSVCSLCRLGILSLKYMVIWFRTARLRKIDQNPSIRFVSLCLQVCALLRSSKTSDTPKRVLDTPQNVYSHQTLRMQVWKSALTNVQNELRVNEWVEMAFLLLIDLILEFLHPHERQFYINDPTISYPMAKIETVSSPLCIVLAIVVPGSIIGGICMLELIGFSFGDFLVFNTPATPANNSGFRARMTFFNDSILGLFSSFVVNTFVTNFLKLLIGNPRPDFLDRCQPKAGLDPLIPYTSDVCTTNNTSVLLEGFKSSPSGHSSTAFCGLLYLTYWTAYQWKLPNANSRQPFFKYVIAAVPVFVATFIAISRTQDNRHHWYDVMAGSILGSCVATIFYRRSFVYKSDAVVESPTSSNRFEEFSSAGASEGLLG